MRPADWSAAGFGSDPIPGDPDTVRHGGHSYLDIARTIDTTVRGLRTLDLESTVSEAIDALGETARTVADDIAKAEARYRATGNALVSYAAALADAQDASVTALQRAQSAQDAASDAQTERRRYLHLSEGAADPADALRYETLADDAGGMPVTQAVPRTRPTKTSSTPHAGATSRRRARATRSRTPQAVTSSATRDR